MLQELINRRDNIIKEKKKYEEKLDDINNTLKMTECLINKLCDHCWETDYIDKKYGEGSERICYCIHCYLIKK
mgnify:CR=1 FL=1